MVPVLWIWFSYSKVLYFTLVKAEELPSLLFFCNTHEYLMYLFICLSLSLSQTRIYLNLNNSQFYSTERINWFSTHPHTHTLTHCIEYIEIISATDRLERIHWWRPKWFTNHLCCVWQRTFGRNIPELLSVIHKFSCTYPIARLNESGNRWSTLNSLKAASSLLLSLGVVVGSCCTFIFRADFAICRNH